MAKIATEARTICPELIDAIKLIDTLAYGRSYSQVFTDFIDWMVWQHQLLQDEDDPLVKYKEKERQYFLSIWQVVHKEVKKQVGLWNGSWRYWYDPLGRIYECITSKNKSSAMGQFFTPAPIVDMMVQMTCTTQPEKLHRIFDPTCGSGRMGLSAGAYCLSQGIPSWITMNDIDPVCAKMSAINMCLHGLVGEVICMNGLDIEGSSYRFGFRIEPALARVPEDLWEFTRMAVLLKTGQDVRKQYVLIPVDYEHTYLKKVNDQLILELEKRRQIEDEQERQKALDELRREMEFRMQGTLFEDDPSIMEDLTIPEKKKKSTKQKKKKPPPKDRQQSLF